MIYNKACLFSFYRNVWRKWRWVSYQQMIMHKIGDGQPISCHRHWFVLHRDKEHFWSSMARENPICAFTFYPFTPFVVYYVSIAIIVTLPPIKRDMCFLLGLCHLDNKMMYILCVLLLRPALSFFLLRQRMPLVGSCCPLLLLVSRFCWQVWLMSETL